MKKIQLSITGKGKNLLMNKILDLLIVIFGITIAFQLNNLKEKSDQGSLEHFYLENLGSDIDKDITSIKYVLKELRYDSALTGICLSQHASGNISMDTLGKAVVNILSFETFNSRNDNTYTTLVNSNGLSIIENKDIRNLINEYYKKYKSIDRFEYVYTEFLLNNFHPYFSSKIDYTTGKVKSTINLGDAQAINNLLIAQGQLKDGINKYNLALKKAFALKKKLESELQ